MAIMMGKVIINHQVWRYPLLDKPNSQEPKWRTVENGGDLHQSLLNILNIQKTSKKIQWSMSCDHTPFNILWCQAAQSILPSHWETCHHFPQRPSSKPPSLRSRVARSEQHRNHEPDRNHRNLDFYPHEGIAVFPKIQQEIPPARHPQRLPLQHRTLALCIDIVSLWLDTWVQNHHSAGVPTQKMWIYSSYADCLNCCWMQTPLPMINGSKWSLTLLIHGI